MARERVKLQEMNFFMTEKSVGNSFITLHTKAIKFHDKTTRNWNYIDSHTHTLHNSLVV